MATFIPQPNTPQIVCSGNHVLIALPPAGQVVYLPPFCVKCGQPVLDRLPALYAEWRQVHNLACRRQGNQDMITGANNLRRIGLRNKRGHGIFSPAGWTILFRKGFFPNQKRRPHGPPFLLIANCSLYVPSDHDARYSSCSGVSLSIFTPMDSSLSRATFLSNSSGTG